MVIETAWKIVGTSIFIFIPATVRYSFLIAIFIGYGNCAHFYGKGVSIPATAHSIVLQQFGYCESDDLVLPVNPAMTERHQYCQNGPIRCNTAIVGVFSSPLV